MMASPETPSVSTTSQEICVVKPSRQLTSHYSNTSLFGDQVCKKLQGLTLALQHPTDNKPDIDIVLNEECEPAKHVISDVMFCNCCQVPFADREEQLIHYKCDWHRYNLHLRLKGMKFVTEDEFELVSGDVSSISGSDEESGSDKEDLNKQSVPTDGSADEKTDASYKERRLDKIFFKNDTGELLSLYKCLFSHKKSPVKSSTEILEIASQLSNQPRWAVFMVSAGHFAGAIFNGNSVTEHKTFHRYTVRAKRGSAQSSRDGQGHAPKSAGASLRRYNEAALNQEVQELITNWQNLLASCSLIFVRIPVMNRVMFYGGKNPVLKKDDMRIRIIPFPTRRPTFSEVKRVQQMLSSIECYGQQADVKDFIPLSPQRFYCKETDQLEIKPRSQTPKEKKEKFSPRKSPAKATVEPEERQEESEDDFVNPVGPGNPLEEFEVFIPKEKKTRKRRPKSGKTEETSTTDDLSRNEEDATQMEMRNSLFTACKIGNMKDLQAVISDLHNHFKEKVHIEQDSISESATENEDVHNLSDKRVSEETRTDKKVSEFLSRAIGDNANTLLHIASQENNSEIISVLLHEGADPALKNKHGKVPYLLGDTESKNVYRRFMALFPSKYDYKLAQIPSPLTPEMESMRKQKNAERRAVKKKSMQERNKVKKEEERKEKEENDKRERFLNLSDREKRALAAERRLLQQHDNNAVSRPVLSRCFQCGADITGKVPFEYSDFKFCTTKCLRDHRAKPNS